MNEWRTGLLHNMSVPPKLAVRYSGLGDLGTVNSSDCGIGTTGYTYPRRLGVPLRFALPAETPVEDPALLLAVCGAAAGADPLRELETLIETRAAELRFPDACLVILAQDSHACPYPDVLSALAVLTKCSAHVWLQSKTPNLSRLRTCKDASLYLPPIWAERFAETPSP